MATFEDRLKEKDGIHAAVMESEQKRREELEKFILSLQCNYNAGQQPNLETNVTQPHAQLEGPTGVSASPTEGVSLMVGIASGDAEMRNTVASREETRPTLPPATEHSATASNFNHQLVAPQGVSLMVGIASGDAEMPNAVASREETRPTLTPVTEHSATASNFNHQAPITSDDAEMQDTSQTNSKWHYRSGKKARYVSVHSSDEDDSDFPLDDGDDMNLVSFRWFSVPLTNHPPIQFYDDNSGPLVPPPHKYSRPRIPKFAYHKATWNTANNFHQVPPVTNTSAISHAGPSISARPTPDDRPLHLSDLQTLVQTMTSSIVHAVQGMQPDTVTPRRRVVVSTKVRAESTRRTKEPLKAALLVSMQPVYRCLIPTSACSRRSVRRCSASLE